MLFPKIVPILEDVDEFEDDGLQVTFSNDGEVESIKAYGGHGYGFTETARVNIQHRLQAPAVGYPYSYNELETTRQFRDGRGRQTHEHPNWEPVLFTIDQIRLCEQAVIEERRERILKERRKARADAAAEAFLLKKIAEERSFEQYVPPVFFDTISGTRTAIGSLLLKATYLRQRCTGETEYAEPEDAGSDVWGFTDPRSFEYLLNPGSCTQLSDYVRLPPDKHDKLRKLCYQREANVQRDVWCEVLIDGVRWRYDIHLEFKQIVNRTEPVTEFHIVEVFGLNILTS